MTTTSGLLLLDKPKGLTSHDVVAGVRKIFDERRVGHAGTLDPMATGLLVLAVGPSTRLLRFAQSEAKRYRGTVQLGVATDSLDADGAVTERRPVAPLDQRDVDRAASRLTGVLQQVPPMVSALKVGGQRLHRLARQGIEVERRAREVTITSFQLTPSDDPTRWDFDVACSVGTYVRVLLSDLAESLGTVGHLTRLRRTASGRFLVDDALTMEQLGDAVQRAATPLQPPASFVTHLEHVTLDADQQRRIRMGQMVPLDGTVATTEIAALNDAGALVAILIRRGDAWKPELVLPDEQPPLRG